MTDVYAIVPMVSGAPVVTFPQAERWRVGAQSLDATSCIIAGAFDASQIQHGPNSGLLGGTGPFLFTFSQNLSATVLVTWNFSLPNRPQPRLGRSRNHMGRCADRVYNARNP